MNQELKEPGYTYRVMGTTTVAFVVGGARVFVTVKAEVTRMVCVCVSADENRK